MRDDEAVSGNNNHDGFKADEETLVVQRLAALSVALAQLVDTVAATDQDEDSGEHEETDEDFEKCWELGFGPNWAAADEVVDEKDDEDRERKDLEAETGEGNVNTGFALAV